ncbi:methyl-accepting chemotaxis protein [Labrenzia sp. PHM005]|uniref:methyl-accepting chemotaxis protein n=1 Tax=Labrenzia sp. PHM005 TaxID=2590016 RepID=UPI0011401FDA|nr:methyl-accepting chemotaxis protein [Labrenzia sp. PHM005]QDG78899.1 HAMP domain-containing protein [Labrenzia sp. PHM005]
MAIKFSDLNISKRLAIGFGAVGLLLPVAVVFSIVQSRSIEHDVGDIANVRAPVTLSSAQLSEDVRGAVSALRGFILNPNDGTRQQHEVALTGLEHHIEKFHKKADLLSAEEQKQWAELETTFKEFVSVQGEITQIIGTPAAFPALKMLSEEATPLTDALFSQITAMIDDEQKLSATAERKALLKTMADVRGNLANSVANLRLYLISGDPSAKAAFEERWAILENRLETLEDSSGIFSNSQSREFAKFAGAYDDFKSVPAELFKLREAPSWNMAAFQVSETLVPLQNQILDFIDGEVGSDGERAGGFKQVHAEKLIYEANHAYSALETMIFLMVGLLVVGLIIGVSLAFVIGRSISGPLVRLSEQISQIADGTLDVTVTDTESGGEIGAMANSLERLRSDLQKADQGARENMRIRVALDNCTTNVMVADNDYDIVYMNESLNEMMQDAEADLREALPQFDAKKLVGANIDQFHKNPAHQRGMLETLTSPYETSLTIGNRIFDLIATPVMDDQGNRLGTVVEWTDKTKEVALERESKTAFQDNMRIRVALDNCSTNVMVADNDFNIVYLNDSVTSMMRNAEADLRKELSQFDVNKLVGSNIDVFHKNPAHQRGMLERLSSTYETSINVAGRIFDLIANPVLDAEGNRLGTVVEWKDVTQERAVENEINTVVNAVVGGNFEERVPLDGKSGFMLSLAEAMNRLCDTTGSALDDVSVNLGALAEGDLNSRITKTYSGSFEDLKNKLNDTASRLGEIVTDVVVGANEVTNASAEITTGTNDLSQRTEQQASNLEETAASMEEIASTIKQNADNAQQANQLAINARGVASDGGEVVGKAVTAMSAIEDSSQKISDIIGVIDEIAFQTNLLALNAAVEAARAGDAGKGFAVVASEVRSLAQRSSEAAKDIKQLIIESGSQVKDGVDLVNNAGTSLTEIVDSVKRVTDIVSEIAAASTEQATGVEEINKAISQMDEMTQQNSALVEENAAACRMLQEQAEGMHQRMSYFSVDAASTAAAAPVRQTKPKPVARAMPAARVASGGGGGAVAAMQSDIETAFDADDDWKEF